jgi:hypothetical protein
MRWCRTTTSKKERAEKVSHCFPSGRKTKKKREGMKGRVGGKPAGDKHERSPRNAVSVACYATSFPRPPPSHTHTPFQRSHDSPYSLCWNLEREKRAFLLSLFLFFYCGLKSRSRSCKRKVVIDATRTRCKHRHRHAHCPFFVCLCY